MQPESLTDYLERRKRREQKARKPAWILRMEAKGLPAKDYTRLTPDRPEVA